ncbi:MAG: FAD-dependent oxidoreductase [Polyangiaceae bacterium]|nr:FAD-dependent oxidoreductase [Polyangiaceae bacterium]
MSTTKLDPTRAETVFSDAKPAYTLQQAMLEANRCLYCHDAPCIKVCPTEINIPEFIRKIGTGNVEGAARTIFDSNVLGMSCARVCPVEVLCVGDCVFNEMDAPPIQIGRLQRFATDAAFEKGWQFFTAGPDTGKSIGLIGGGPASLAAAHRLRRFGHRVTIYEKGTALGGLNTTGVAPYKLRADDSLSEVEWVLAIGDIKIESNVDIPSKLAWSELEKRHDALFLGFGLGLDSVLDVPGKDLAGVRGAVDFIAEMKAKPIDLSSVTDAVVIGGGNTAVDAVRELLGLRKIKGSALRNVTMVYRGTEEVMSGYKHEFAYAKQEGARAAWRSQPIAYEGTGKVSQVKCKNTDPNGAGEVSTIPAQLVLLAVGQAKLGDLVSGLDGVVVERGVIKTDVTGATGRPGVYAGGDCRNGGKEVVNAVAEGRDAAVAIDAFLKSGGRQ